MVKVYVVPKDNSRKEKIKAWLKNRKTDVQCFWDENKETIVALSPVVIGGVTMLVKTYNKHVTVKKEQRLKELYVWDNKLGRYWLTKRKLTNAEGLEIERRKNNGEPLGQILASMKLLQ